MGMNLLLKLLLMLSFLSFLRCEENKDKNSHLAEIDRSHYYDKEIIPAAYNQIYGKWKLKEISGGFSGKGYEPDFDFLEIKSIGIYGLVRNNVLFEYGKIELVTFDANRTDALQIRFIPDDSVASNPYMTPPEKYLDLTGPNTLDIQSPCCDMYNYHFERAIQDDQ